VFVFGLESFLILWQEIIDMKKLYLLLSVLLLFGLLFGCFEQTAGFPILSQDSNSDKKYTSVVNNLDQYKIAKSGNAVKVNYTGRFLDGKVFDSSLLPGRTPLEFVIDDGGMIKGFNGAVKGMKVGETKTVTLPPEQAYGVSDPTKIVTLDKNQFADFASIQEGMTVTAGNYSGIVITRTDTNAIIDFNPEMAGKTLVFEITLLEIND